MQTILAHAQQLVYTLLSLMPSQYQRDNLEAMLGLFLEAQGRPLPQHSKTKSASALSWSILPLAALIFYTVSVSSNIMLLLGSGVTASCLMDAAFVIYTSALSKSDWWG